MQKQFINNNYRNICLGLALIAVPVIIYFYFLKWETLVIYGDDLSIYTNYFGLNTLYEKINLPLSAGKYRPIYGLSMSFLIETFHKNLEGYYLFNIAIQTLVTFSFALIINLFLKSPIYSLFVSLTVGLSRFAFFNITQLLNGGALEGLAMMFFLLSLYFILKALVTKEVVTSSKVWRIALSIIFANLCIYTHERYIVVFPFIILIILFFPSLKDLTRKQKLTLIIVSLLSLVLNIFIKKYIYSTNFLVGTGGTNISFSFSTVLQFVIEGILSIIQINSGPQHLVGIPFTSLPVFYKLLAIITCSSILIIFLLYLSKIRKLFVLKQTKNYLLVYVSKKQSIDYNNLPIFVSLVILFIFLLASAVITIRLEPRWLQAPLSIFILMFTVALSSIKFSNKYVKNTVFSVLILLFMFTDYIYLSKGAANIYLVDAEKTASNFKQALDNNIIRESTSNLYIFRKQKDINIENAIKWFLIDGEFFHFYQNKSKKIIFIDSTSEKPFINEQSDQIISIDDSSSISTTIPTLPTSSPENTGLKVLRWGPDELKAGTIPNVQPDGNMGIWIEVTSTQGFDDAVVLFDGDPVPTSVQEKNITAGINPKGISEPGSKKVEIRSLAAGKTVLVGTLKIIP